MITLLNANAVHIPLDDNCVQTVPTSPPYLGQRRYSGIEPTVWPSVKYTPMVGLPSVTIPGDIDCEHTWGKELPKSGQVGHGQGGSTLTGGHDSWGEREGTTQGQFCHRCGAWKGTLGNEPSPMMYVAHLVLIFREIHRVLHPSGTVWLNLGSSYAGSNKGITATGQVGGKKQRTNKGSLQGLRKTGTPQGFKPKDLIPIPWMVAMALQADGWWLRSDIIWAKSNCMPSSVQDRCTTSHEYLFMLAKSKSYFYDQEAVKETSTEQTGAAADFRRQTKELLLPGQTAVQHRMNRKPTKNSGKRNRRSVWTLPTSGFAGSHFAVFPEKLVEPCIRAGTSCGCCPRCRAPWERVTEKQFIPQEDVSAAKGIRGHDDTKKQPGGWDGFPRGANRVTTTGWRPTCTCKRVCPSCAGGSKTWTINSPCCQNKGYVVHDPIPCLVLDPFCGTGTTGIVARREGCDFVGLDASAEYIRMARQRLELDKLKTWEKGCEKVTYNLKDLPLFNEMERN